LIYSDDGEDLYKRFVDYKDYNVTRDSFDTLLKIVEYYPYLKKLFKVTVVEEITCDYNECNGKIEREV
jgi:hypothetical protein